LMTVGMSVPRPNENVIFHACCLRYRIKPLFFFNERFQVLGAQPGLP
jgi:hypothetical protein